MNILLIDDHAVVREGVRRLLEAGTDASIVEAASGPQALALFQDRRPDLVLLDLNLPGLSGLELLRRFLLKDPKIRVIVLTMHAEPIYAARALQAGARGYVSKGASAEELVAAVQRVASGGRYVEQEIEAELILGDAEGNPLDRLTNRETDILRLLGDGKSPAAIAEALGISYKTVANICGQMKSKLMVERMADLVRLAVELRRP